MNNYKHKPNLKAPRWNAKTFNASGRTTFFKFFRSKYPEYKDFSEKEIRKIIKTFNETIVEQVIENRHGVELPEFCGRIFIGSCKKKKINIDYKKTADNNKVMQHRNFESDDYLAKIFYSTYDIKHAYKNHELYAFKACRNFSRFVSKTYPNNWKTYIQVGSHKKITGLYRQAMDRLERRDKTEEYLKTYDEFDF